MIDEREIVRRAIETLAPPEPSFDRLLHRRDRVVRNRRIRAGLLGVAVALATGWFAVDAIRSARVPTDDPSEDLGMFRPVAGRIVFENEGDDRGYDAGIWAADPDGPSDTAAGPSVAEDVVSALVPLEVDGVPLGWSRDGTELLLLRTDGDQLFPRQYLSVLHADGTEIQLNRDPMYFGGAAISPDGTRVVFAAWGDDLGLYVVDADGGRPARLPLPRTEGIVADPTFSPDGTQIAYVDTGESKSHVWLMDADGSDPRELLADGETSVGLAGSLQWSPAGERIALQVRSPEPDGINSIYTIAPDGSDLTHVVSGATSPYWSPDGSRIAFTFVCDERPDGCASDPGGLAIADADGSNVREFRFAASGPWHPGVTGSDAPTPSFDEHGEDGVVRTDGEVLRFTGTPSAAPGDLVAVQPETGEERVLVAGLDTVYSARWSADGRWVAYETPGPQGTDVWVVGAAQAPRLVASGAAILGWSSTGAELSAIRLTSPLHTDISGSTLTTIDPATGASDEVGRIPSGIGDVTSAPALSPDGARFVFGARGGAIYALDVRSGEASLLARLPGDRLDSVDRIAWSPDGAHIAVVSDGDPGGVHVIDHDGSNVRALLEGSATGGPAWSLDGTRLAYLDGSGIVWVAAMDPSAPTEIGPLSASCTSLLLCQADLIWSPDGSRIALRNADEMSVDVSAIDAETGASAAPIDPITFASWDGGSYGCGCV